jgi:tetratricopeptide (TPR) repeat protein
MDPAARRPLDEPGRRDGSSAGIQLPRGTGIERGGPDAGARRAFDESEASPPEPVVLRVSPTRPPPRTRQATTSDTPQTDDVKALIAQRLKLLEHGADHFKLLGVSETVSPDALRKAYFALARRLHPDRLAALGIEDDGKHAQRLFAQINSGFAVLSDQARRAQYVDVLRRGGEAAVRAEQARAEELARRILEAEEAFRRAELALKRDQPKAAVVELELAIARNPDEADYHALLAWAQFCAAPDKPAIAATTRTLLDQAIQRSPRAVTARFCLGRVERMLGRDQEALRHFRDVIGAAPGHADAAAELRVLEARLKSDGRPSGGLFGRSKR